MNILIDTGNAPAHTGIGVYSFGLLDALRQFGGNGIVVHESQASWTGSSLRPLRRLIYLRRMASLSRKDFGGSDVVHFTNYYVPRPHPKVAYVTTIHDIDAIIHPEVYTRRYRAYFGNTVAEALERADVVLTVTEASRTSLLERFPAAEERVRAVGIGLSQSFLDAAERAAAEEDSEPPIALFVGRLSSKKNCAWLIQEFSYGVRSRVLPRMQLVLAGSRGFGFDEIKVEIGKHAELVKWVRNPSVTELVGLYRRSSVVVLPSRTEGFGIPLIEAMFFRKPLVASRIPSSLEVAADAAYFFDLDNRDEFFHAFTRAVEDVNGEKRKQFIANHLKKYTWPNLVPQYLTVYQSAINRHFSVRSA